MFLPCVFRKDFHHFPALGDREITGTRIDDLHARIVLQDFSEALVAIIGRRGIDRAHQFDDVGLAVRQLGHDARSFTALFKEVRTHEGRHRGPGGTSARRSTRMIGMPASLASWKTSSQPVSVNGATPITSTLWAINERMALIWFSCFCCASENLSSTPNASAASLTEAVFAERHSLSAPSWAYPTIRSL